VEFGIPYYKSSEEEAGEITRQFIVPFELDKVPLLRIGLIDIGESRHILMIDMHHIISDRASVAVLIKEVRQLYQGEELPALRNQYKDFSQWQNKGKEKEWIIKQENFWLKEFEDGVPVLDLPTDYARPMLQSFEGDSIDFGIQKEQVDKLNSLAAGSGATMFMVLLAVFNVFFSKLSGQGDIIVGTAIEGRGHEDLRQMIGVFVNTLPLRNYPGGNKTFAVFLDEVRRRTLKAFDNQDYQFEDLVEKVVIKRDASHNPLFDVMFQYEKTRETQERIQGLKLTPLSYGHSLSKFDINLLALESKDHLHFVIDYCTKLFKRETVRRFVTFFMNILAAILNDPSTGISDIDVLPEEEKQQILYDFNDTGAEYPKNKTLYELFAEQAERSPNRIAIKGNCQWSIVNGQLSVEEEHLSYKELNEKSRQLAYLLQEKGLRPDTTAAIMADRSMEMIIGLMGILKAGGAYLPLDPEYPRERIDYMLADSKVNILVKNSKISSDIALGEDVDVIYSNDALHKNPPGDAVHLHLQPAPAASLAYIIYTSGSTGRPKGVLIQHHSVVNLVFSQMRRFNINEDDRVLQFSSLCFDASVEQIFISLFSGAILVLIDKNTLLDTDKFEEFTASHSITHIHAVPSFLVNIKLEQAYHLKRILSGGDVCPVSLAGKLSRCCDFYNRYGPTETTVTSIEMMFKPGDVDEVLPRLPIGKPVNNTFIYLFDKWMKLVPLAVAGELYIGGDGVARGYLNQPELTAEKFLSFFYRSYMSSRSYISKKIYKTGDLGRWLTDGNIEFLGRIDHQVKIKGYRVELGEIESQLLHHERIKEAVVLVREHEPGDKYLYAYVVPEPAQEKNPLNLTELKDYLSQKLPGYMLPSYFLSLEKLPLTPNGKIDRRSLDSLGKKLNTGIEYMAPGSNKEKMIAQTWKDVLKHERIGINDNFFDLGGNSLNIIQIIGKLREQLDMDLSLVAMFEFPTIRTFSQYLSRLNPGGNPHDMKIDRSGAIAAAKKSKLEQQARRKRRN
jgi:amino acid adenylation domain-containing protein